MKHAKTILALGIAVALLPFLGFPSSWKNILFALLGGSIAVLAYRIMARSRPISQKETQHEHQTVLPAEPATINE